MSENAIRNIFKYLSIAFIVLSAAMLFSGGVGIRDKTARASMSASVDGAIEKIDMDDEDIAKTEAGMALFGVEMDLRSLIDQAKRVLNVARDGRLSASEIAFTGTNAIKLINELKGNKLLTLLSEKDLDEVLNRLDDASMRMYIVVAFFWVTLLCCAVMIVLHVLDLKLPGVSVVILNLLWLIVFIVIKVKVNEMIVSELEGPADLLTVTAAPALGFTAAIVAMVLWIIKDMVARKLGNDTVPFYMESRRSSRAEAPSAGRVKTVGAAGVSAVTDKPETYEPETYEPETYEPETYEPETHEPETYEQAAYDTVTAGQPYADDTATSLEYVSEPDDTEYEEIPEADASDNTTGDDMVRSLTAGDFVYSGNGVDYRPEDIRFCPKCGTKVDPDYDFCGECGFKIFSR